MPKKTKNSSNHSTASSKKKSAGKSEGESSVASKKKKLDNKENIESENIESENSDSENIENDELDKENQVTYKAKCKNCNFFKFHKNYEMGLPCHRYRKPLKDIVINYCKTFKLYKVESTFDRRVTFMVWHPTNPRVLSVTSHWGDVLLYNYEQDMNSACLIKGIGPGGSVQSMKFDPLNPTRIYTASMEGKFLVLNFETKEAVQFLETNDINRWYISVDVNSANNMMVAGDTRGSITLLTLQGEIIDTIQIHKKGFKVSHAEFSKREPWLLCTSSTDSTIKLWDIRNMKSDVRTMMAEPLQKIQHKKPINAAYFSLTDGCRLLTTDQMDKIQIYRAPLWNLETVIHHPHRQFQHLTPIKAYWHPLEDIVFVGRYPHNKFPGYHVNELRTLDFFDAETGELLHQHHESTFNGILTLNRFNITGDVLASSSGSRFLIWKPDFRNLERKSRIEERLGKKENKGDFSKSSRKKGPKYDDDEDDDDEDDDDEDNDDGVVEINWEAVLKQQTKDKQAGRKKDTTKKKKQKG